MEDSNQIVLDLLLVDSENVATGTSESGQVIMLTLSISPTSSTGVRLDVLSPSRFPPELDIRLSRMCRPHASRPVFFNSQGNRSHPRSSLCDPDKGSASSEELFDATGGRAQTPPNRSKKVHCKLRRRTYHYLVWQFRSQ